MSQSESVEQESSEAPDQNEPGRDIPVNSDGDESADEPETREDFERRIEELEAERDEFKEKYLRKVADLDNLRKRKQEEQEKQQKYANKNLLEDLLEIVDNFDRALDSMEFESGEVEDGIRMIRQQLDDLLDRYNVERIDAAGQRFDPNYHEGMMQEVRDDLDEREVLEVFQEGYTLHDRVLRPAQVKVGVPESNEATDNDDHSSHEE